MDPKDKPATWLSRDVEGLMEGLNDIVERLLDMERRMRRLENILVPGGAGEPKSIPERVKIFEGETDGEN